MPLFIGIMRGRVLVIEDEPALLRALGRLLERAGFEVELSSTAPSAVERVSQVAFDAVVSDIRMPDMDGIQLLRAVRERDLDLPVILVTAAPNVQTAAQAVELGAFQYLVKPVARDDLERSVARAVLAGSMARAKRQNLRTIGADIMLLGDRAGLEAAFARATGSLSTVYQPIVRTSDRCTVAYEVFLRTDEPLLSKPDVMVLAAERLEQVDALGCMVRERSIVPPASLMLFVNVHGSELVNGAFGDRNSPLAGFSDRVVLEVSERVALDQLPGLTDAVARLRATGLRIALDDVGAGYAGLSSFAALKPDFVKLDISLIRDLDTNATKYRIIGAMAMLAKDLGITTVAEGVETEAERDALVELGVDLLQGYRFARPGRAFPRAEW
jgi:EAL domain-containing protein (putative c-di-GMP-specific phosphodiesterase class I)